MASLSLTCRKDLTFFCCMQSKRACSSGALRPIHGAGLALGRRMGARRYSLEQAMNSAAMAAAAVIHAAIAPMIVQLIGLRSDGLPAM